MQARKQGRIRCIERFILPIGLCCAAAFAADTANFDTAWTYVYDGGKTSTGKVIADIFRDVEIAPNGDAICVGQTRDSTFLQSVLVVKLSPQGESLGKKLLGYDQGSAGTSVLIAKNGSYFVGGERASSPLLVRMDASLNVKSSTWYYDSTAKKDFLSQGAALNSMIESADGRIAAAAGDVFPDNNGFDLGNYGAYLEFDSLGTVKLSHEWLNSTGFELAGWSIASGENGGYMLGGKQAVFLLDTLGRMTSQKQYTFSLAGVGTVTNNVSRVRRLRNGMVMAAGQSYEEDCWTRYGRLYHDAWWSPLSSTGKDDFRYTAGVSGANDYLYDFTQLTDGRIAFAGVKATASDSGIWVFVTDSTGKTIQWQKQYNLPGLENGSARNNILPLSIAATPDSGFILVGLEAGSSNDNACAFKFSPKPNPLAVRRITGQRDPSVYLSGDRLFSGEVAGAADVHFRLFTAEGRLAAEYRRHLPGAGRWEFMLDRSRVKAGVYVWQLVTGGVPFRGMVAISG
jgi:hypothetical protein